MSLTIDGKITKKTFGNNDFYSLIDAIYGSKMTLGLTEFSETVTKNKNHWILTFPLHFKI